MKQNQLWLGVDLGGTKVLVGVFDDNFKLLGRAKLPTEADRGPDVVFANVRKSVEEALADAKAEPGQVRAAGMGIPGMIDPVGSKVRFAPNLNWTDLDPTTYLKPHWSWPCFFHNDVQLGTYGEYAHGAAKGARHALGIFVGTGVGGGLILDGAIYHGFNYCAGEIGHTIIHWRKGTELEDIAGRRKMVGRAKDFLEDAPKKTRKDWKDIDPVTIKSSKLADLYKKEDLLATHLIHDAARALGASIASAIDLIGPEVVVLGGGVATALGEPFLERIWEVAQKYALPSAIKGVRLVQAALEDDAGIYGAAEYARSRVRSGIAAEAK